MADAPTDAPTVAAMPMPRHAMDVGALERLADGGVLHAVIDACDAPGVPERVLALGPDAGACLYQGDEANTFRDRAPYLARVDRALLGWLTAPVDAGGLGGTPWGMFTIGELPFAEQLRHWRSWLTVTAPEAPGTARETWTFRFYDPRLVPVFLAACTADEVAAFFGPVRSIVVPAPDAGAALAGWMLAPGLGARSRSGRRPVGERFPLRDAHLTAFQRRSFGDALIASVERESAVTGQRAWRDPADPEAGDVLVSGAGAASVAAGTASAQPLRIGFDDRGFVGAVTSPLGRRWTIGSDQRGRPTRLTTPAGAGLQLDYDALGEVAQVARRTPTGEQLVFTAEHDAVGRLRRATYADGTSHRIDYDTPAPALPDEAPAFDPGVLDPTGARPSVVTDRLGRTTRYAYAADGTLTAITDPLGRATRYGYGQWQRPAAVAHPDGRRERYAYDAEGQLTAITLADGVLLEVRTDDAGRTVAIASEGRPDAESLVAAVNVAFVRDGAGRVLAATTEAASRYAAPTAASFGYDDAGRVLTDVVTVGTFGPHAPGAGPGDAPLRSAVAYAYDAQGTLVALTYPTGEAVSYERDADARLTSVTDWAGERYEIAYAPNDAGWTLTTPAGIAVTARQNAVGRPTETTATAADGRVLFTASVGYDAEDRVVGVDDARLGAWRYGRDAEGQLLACDGPTAAECARYAYDAAGNRIEVREGEAAIRDDAFAGVAVEVDAGDRLLRQGTQRLGYDDAGRLVARSDDAGLGAGGQWRYAYDARGQMVRAWGRGADGVLRAMAFGYDAFGRRVRKLALARPSRGARVDGRRTRFVWAGEQCVREVIEESAWAVAVSATSAADPDRAAAALLDGALLDGAMPAGTAWRVAEARDYLYWPGSATPLLLRVARPAAGAAIAADVRTYLYHTDHLGAPVRLTDAGGAVVWEAAYAPFGAVRETVAEVAQPWRRPGQYWDAETGLAYNRFRYYDPRLGRYLTPDPVGPIGGSHLYRYAGNAPVDDADPLGLWPSLGTIVAAVAAVAVAVAVVALAPVALGVGAILLAGIAAGAVFGLLNEGLNNGFGCLSCLAGATLKGAIVGGLAAVPFMFLPAAAGVAAFAGVGAGSGAISYTADWALNGADPNQWSWAGFAGSTAFGAVTAGAGRYLAPRASSWWRGRSGTAAGDGATPPASNQQWVRRDNHPYSAQGRTADRLKSHVDADGNLRPANPNGTATVKDHVRGAEPLKSDSPYTSLTEQPTTSGGRYGNSEVRVDVDRLRQDIASGKVRDVELLDHREVVSRLNSDVARAEARYANNPTPKNAEALDRARQDVTNATRDAEVLVRGVVPSEYVTVVPPTP